MAVDIACNRASGVKPEWESGGYSNWHADHRVEESTDKLIEFIFTLLSLFLKIHRMLISKRPNWWKFDNTRLRRMPNLAIWIVNLFDGFTSICL